MLIHSRAAQGGCLMARKIFDGVRPADLPPERPDSFVLTINLSTVRQVGLEVRPAVLARAAAALE
jgi:putative ABC transport system substrate-binding protein